MYQCPSCGSNLKFDIASQQMLCDHCRTQVDPYQVTKEQDAEVDTFDVTVFRCPQCGGEIMSTENSAAEFCSFCGASTILTSRISKEKRPGFIIPFKKTKEECKAAYAKKVKSLIYAPKEMKNAAYIDGFRGIYIPYWAFDIANNGRLSIKGEKSHRSGDYIITDHYQLNCDVDAYYRGISYDASSSFDDSLSDAIAPYDVHDMMNFTPAFLSGFYADTDDVPASIYENDAKELTYGNTFKNAKSKFFGYTITSNENVVKGITSKRAVDRTMYPVWFLSYRNKDRVAYAVVNGQTGKVTADIPVAPFKYFIGSLLIAIPLFFLLNSSITMTFKALLGLVGFISIISQIIYTVMLSKIRKRECNLDDKGYQYKYSGDYSKAVNVKKNRSKKNGLSAGSIATIIIFMIFALYFFGEYVSSGSELDASSLVPILTLVSLGLMIGNISTLNKTPLKKGFPAHVLNFISMVTASLVVVSSPFEDFYYYGVVLFMLVCIVISNLTIIGKHNILSTKRLPQFDRKGGDDRA